MLILLVLLVLIYIYAVNHQVGFGEALGRFAQFIFDVVMFLMLIGACFAIVYLGLGSIGVQNTINVGISLVSGAIAAVLVFHKTNEV